ncbi:hypothetical protein PoB_000302600 [Plakobranchus ocellatus]|uniref:Uncharacterized protein n=1 Tax=Plakobranchus ocellatus TaxID=259542 RepID=A0AAV3XFI4_9GAST|nr:hypothetical protein PoB_000302600 [Plakobranchus ocellatus]
MPEPTPSHSPSATVLITETSSPHADNDNNHSQDQESSSYTITHTLETTEIHSTNICNTDVRNIGSSHYDRTNTTYTALHHTDKAAGTSFSTNITWTANQVHDSICNSITPLQTAQSTPTKMTQTHSQDSLTSLTNDKK